MPQVGNKDDVGTMGNNNDYRVMKMIIMYIVCALYNH